MNWIGRDRVRRLALLGLAATMLIATGCGARSLIGWPGTALQPDTEAEAVTVNVDVSAAGFSPRDVKIPAGPSVQLLLRNRGNEEFHYRVLGLSATELLWLAPPEDMVREAGVSDDAHASHHPPDRDFVNWRGTSPGGVKPTLTEVHAYAASKAVDVLRFYALKPGTYQVVDPLHPDLRGTLTVYAP